VNWSVIRFWTSRQVLREYLASITRPGAFVPQPAIEKLCQAVRLFEAELEIADEDAAVTAVLLDLLTSRGVQGKHVHDANIVATMRRYGIAWLFAQNTADFTRSLPEINILPLIG
jgi:predicted nucleic acid-binding protein